MSEDKEPRTGRYWHELYIEAQSDPFDTRTDADFCRDIQLDYNTFAVWKRKYRNYIFKDVEARRTNYKNELRSKGHKALAKKLDKDTNAIKLLFQLLGDLVEKTESKVEMSTDDKIRRLRTLLGSTGKRVQSWETIKEETPIPSEPKGPEGPPAP